MQRIRGPFTVQRLKVAAVAAIDRGHRALIGVHYCVRQKAQPRSDVPLSLLMSCSRKLQAYSVPFLACCRYTSALLESSRLVLCCSLAQARHQSYRAVHRRRSDLFAAGSLSRIP